MVASPAAGATWCMRGGAVDRRGLVQRHQLGRMAVPATWQQLGMRSGQVDRCGRCSVASQGVSGRLDVIGRKGAVCPRAQKLMNERAAR